MRDEAGSWGGVLKNNTECSIAFLQWRETADKLQHTREETLHQKKSKHTMQYDTCMMINYLSAPLDPQQAHDLTHTFPLSVVLQSKSFYKLTDNQRKIQLKNTYHKLHYLLDALLTSTDTFFNIYSNICGGQERFWKDIIIRPNIVWTLILLLADAVPLVLPSLVSYSICPCR